jgi:hypothetical protein
MQNETEKLALLSDSEAHSLLNRVVDGYAARNRDIPVADDRALALILQTIGHATGNTVKPRADSEITDAIIAERAILVELSRNATARRIWHNLHAAVHRLTYAQARTLAEHAVKELSRVYRRAISDGLRLYVNNRRVEAFDPMYAGLPFAYLRAAHLQNPVPRTWAKRSQK